MLVKALSVFLVFDLMTRELLFDVTIPHLKYLASHMRQDTFTHIASLFSEMSDKYGYTVIVGIVYHSMDIQKSFVVNLTLYTAIALLGILKSI